MIDNSNRSTAATRMIRIVDTLHEHGELGVTELGDQIDLSKGGVHKYLKSMEDLGWVENEQGKYRLALRFLTIGGKVRRNRIASDTVDKKISQLSEETGMTAGFGVESKGVVFTNFEYVLNSMRRYLPIGARFPLHTTAAGKAILAQKSDDKIRSLVEKRGLAKYTDATITDVKSLLREINKVRGQLYAVAIGERIEDWAGAATIVDYPDERFECAISIGGPTRTLTREKIEKQHQEPLLRNASELEIMLR